MGRIVTFTSVTLDGVITTSRRSGLGAGARWPARPRCRRLGFFSFRDLAAPGRGPIKAISRCASLAQRDLDLPKRSGLPIDRIHPQDAATAPADGCLDQLSGLRFE